MKLRHLLALLFVGQFIFVVHITDDPWLSPNEALLGVCVQLLLVYGIAHYLDREDRESVRRANQQRFGEAEARRKKDAQWAAAERRKHNYATFLDARRSNRLPTRTPYPHRATFTAPGISRGWTKDFKRHLVRDWHHVCPWCGEFMDDEVTWTEENELAVTVDHIRPRSRGGTDDIENLQPMHWGCNKQKGVGPMDRAPKVEQQARSRIERPPSTAHSAPPNGSATPTETAGLELPWTMRRHVYQRQAGLCFKCDHPLDFDEAVFKLAGSRPFTPSELRNVRARHDDCFPHLFSRQIPPS